MNIKNRTIFTRDNLEVMRGMKDACIELIYIDPPFNSKANYAAPIGSEAAGAEFKDTWGLDDIDLAWYGEIAEQYPALYELLTATRSVHSDSMMSYLIYMAIRVMEMKRILKDNGSIYLHCDHHASHYLKLMMDCLFNKKSFRNEIVWCYRGGGVPKKDFARKHDIIFRYATGENPTFNVDAVRIPYSEDSMGRLEYTARSFRKNHVYDNYRPNDKGKHPEDWWTMQPIMPSSKERVGYPTQKPLALLSRIIKASSNEGDMVLDPFCGCATACIAAEIEHRQWIGIDIGPKAYDLVKTRLKRDVKIGEGAIFGDVIHRTDVPSDYKGTKSKNIKHIRYGEQEGKCTGCREHFPFRNMTVDHIIPRAKGGADTDDNIQLLCGACNSKKGSRQTHDELIASLIQEGIRKGN